MNSKLFILLTSVTFIFNIFDSCKGDTYKSSLADLTAKRVAFRGPSFGKVFGKRSVDQDGENVGEYDDYYLQEPEEPQCADDQFWHIRGLRCVPFECPGGNQFRDKNNGECILKTYGISSGDLRGRQVRFFNSRMKSPTKFRLPFGLTLKG